MLPLSERLADPERELALGYAPRARRPALRALWRLDERFGQLVARNREPLVAEMRLLWWREALERLGDRSDAEPLLQDLARDVRPCGIAGEELGAMAGGWRALLVEPFGAAEMEAFAAERGGRLFVLSARVLEGREDDRIRRAGEAWALVDLARRSIDREDAVLAQGKARAIVERDAPWRWPRKLRPVGMLAALARADATKTGDLTRQGAPSRVARMVWHALTGK